VVDKKHDEKDRNKNDPNHRQDVRDVEQWDGFVRRGSSRPYSSRPYSSPMGICLVTRGTHRITARKTGRTRTVTGRAGYFVERTGTRLRISVDPLTNVHHMTSTASNDTESHLIVRRARTSDVPEIKRLIDIYAGKILLEKNLVTLYEAVQEFWVAEKDGQILGCGAMHVLWADLGEIRTVAVDPTVKGQGAGFQVVDKLIEVARELELERLFVLTFETDFFHRHGFVEIEGTPVTAEVYTEMCRSYDAGVAEFLDLSYVKPNTLGNTRMLLTL
jgi:amino-acid N-acetyltransferase